MNIIGILSKNDDLIMPHERLLNYTLSLFEQCQTEVINVCNSKEGFENLIRKSPVLVISGDKCNVEEIVGRIDKQLLVNKPVFLLSTSNTGEVEIMGEFFERVGMEVWECYSLPNFHENFDGKEDVISTVRLRLELIRKVNYILYNQLGLKDKDRTSCGIERDKYEYGDESDY